MLPDTPMLVVVKMKTKHLYAPDGHPDALESKELKLPARSVTWRYTN